MDIYCKKCKKKTNSLTKKLCHSCYCKEYYKNNKEKVLNRKREYYKENMEKISQYGEICYKKNKKTFLQKSKEYRINNPDYDKKRYHNYIDGKIRIGLNSGNPYFICRGGKHLHRIIAEKALDRKLKSNEIVHHIDGNTLNNNNSNLLICTKDYHHSLHSREIGKRDKYGKFIKQISN